MLLFILQLDVTVKLVSLCQSITFYGFLLYFVVGFFSFSLSLVCLSINQTENEIKILRFLSTGQVKSLRSFLINFCICPRKKNATNHHTSSELFYFPDIYLRNHFTMKISTLSGLLPASQRVLRKEVTSLDSW